MTKFSLTYKVFEIVTNSIGLFFSFLGVLTYIYIYSVNRSLVNRTSIRLQTALSSVDFLSHIKLFFGENNYSVFGNFGPGNNGFCFIDSKAENHKIMFFYLLVIPNFIVFLYCLAIIILVAIKVRGVNDILEKILDGHAVPEDSKNILEKMFHSWMSRFLVYPIAFIIIRSGMIVDFSLQSFGFVSNVLFYWSVSGGYLIGLINYIAFLCDPYFQDAIMDIIFFKLGKNNEIKKTRYEIHMDELNVKRQEEALNSYIDSKRKNKTKYLYDEHEARALLRECTCKF